MKKANLRLSEDQTQIVDSDGNVIYVAVNNKGTAYFVKAEDVHKSHICIGWEEIEVCVKWGEDHNCLAFSVKKICVEWQDFPLG